MAEIRALAVGKLAHSGALALRRLALGGVALLSTKWLQGLSIGGRVLENSGYLPTIIGFVAGILSTVSFAPQVYKAWREGTQSISLRMYMITVTSFTLWTVYGLLLKSAPLIIFNALSLMMSGTILALKLRNLKQDKCHAG
jgi:MtN3 and saliva related transmembrane protein